MTNFDGDPQVAMTMVAKMVGARMVDPKFTAVPRLIIREVQGFPGRSFTTQDRTFGNAPPNPRHSSIDRRFWKRPLVEAGYWPAPDPRRQLGCHATLQIAAARFLERTQLELG